MGAFDGSAKNGMRGNRPIQILTFIQLALRKIQRLFFLQVVPLASAVEIADWAAPILQVSSRDESGIDSQHT